MSFDDQVRGHKDRLLKLEGHVEQGAARLAEPERVRRQAEEADAACRRVCPSRPEPGQPLRPQEPPLLELWKQRGRDAEASEVPRLKEAEQRTLAEADAIGQMTREVAPRLARARRLDLQQPAPDLVRRLGFWERVRAVFRQGQVSAFFPTEVREPQSQTTTVEFAAILDRARLPDVTPLEAAVNKARKQTAADWPELLRDLDRIDTELGRLDAEAGRLGGAS